MLRTRSILFRLPIALAMAAASIGLIQSSAHAAAPDEIQTLITELDAPTLEIRNRAMQRLIDLECDLAMLEAANVKMEKLTAEQRNRIDHTLYECFKRTPRAGMGVAFDAQFVRGVRLASVVPEFPAAEFLQPLDRITKVEGVTLSNYQNQQGWLALRRRILSFDPGESMPMEIERENKRLKLNVPLGSYNDLDRASPITEEDYTAAWSYRRQRMSVELRDAKRIEAPDAGVAWAPMTPLDEFRMKPEFSLLAGGAPNARPILRLEALDQRARRTMAARGQMNRGDVRARVQIAIPQQGGVQDQIARRQLLLRQVAEWERNIVEYRLRASDPALTEQERSKWAQQVVSAEARLAVLQQELEKLDQD